MLSGFQRATVHIVIRSSYSDGTHTTVYARFPVITVETNRNGRRTFFWCALLYRSNVDNFLPRDVRYQHRSVALITIEFYLNYFNYYRFSPSWFTFSTSLTENGYQVIASRNVNDEDTPGRYVDHWAKYFYMCLDSNMRRRTIKGVIIIYDMAVTNRNELLTQFTPSFVKKTLHCSVNNRIRIYWMSEIAVKVRFASFPEYWKKILF